MSLDLEQTIREYLPDILHMSLGTSVDNKPWVCEVHFSYDEDLNLYFRSHQAARHSQEIEKNPHVAGNIVTQHGFTDKPRGIYFEGRAEKLQNVDEHHAAYKAVEDRYQMGQRALEEANAENGKMFYKIIVSDFYIFDARDSKPAQKFHLPWKPTNN
jgi:uncharacterized protein YhbP (UPF0306 family)